MSWIKEIPPTEPEEEDIAALRAAGFDDADIGMRHPSIHNRSVR